MKSAIPWVLVAALLGCAYFLYTSNQITNRERAPLLAQLTQNTQELESLRAENAELKKIPLQTEELGRLRKEHDELLKLRGESQRLRDQVKQLNAQLTAALSQVKVAQAQAAQAQQPPQPQPPPSPNDGQPKRDDADAKAVMIQSSMCMTNLRQIEGAKQQWALENKKSADAVPTPEEISPYLPNPAQIVCPAGGVYSVNAVGVMATCTVPGHALGATK